MARTASDPFGFVAAINWDVVDKLTDAEVDEINAMFDTTLED